MNKKILEEVVMMKRSYGVIVLMMVFAILILAPLGAQAKYKLSFGSMQTPGDHIHAGIVAFIEAAKNLSGGDIEIEHFGQGQMGDQKTKVLKCMRGTADMATTSASWLANLVPYAEIGVFGAGYVFRDLEHVYRVMDGPVAKKMFEDIRQKGNIRILDVWYLGTRELNLTKKVGVVRTPEDMKGVKIRMPNTPTWLDLGKALGANPTPLGFGEVYMALKTGTVQGQDNPLPVDEAYKFTEVTQYIVLTDHLIDTIYIVINEDTWQSMPEEYRGYLKKAALVGRFQANYLATKEETELIGKFREKYGMDIIVPDRQAFRKYAADYYSQSKFQEEWGAGKYEYIQNYE
jgi:tripartite ATP-independent transporter DctP family solute receptor